MNQTPRVSVVCRRETRRRAFAPRSAAIRPAVTEVLGPDCGLVRVRYFEKPPGRRWSLPWHRDMAIAVRDHHRDGTQFRKPTLKADVPHVEAPEGG